MYSLQFLVPAFFGMFVVIVQYVRQDEMRQNIFKEVNDYIHCIE